MVQHITGGTSAVPPVIGFVTKLTKHLAQSRLHDAPEGEQTTGVPDASRVFEASMSELDGTNGRRPWSL
jgi:hypothetical protein